MTGRGRSIRRSAPTLHDVARKAQVSIMTVSRVLNGSPRVADETRARVLRAAEELEYRPSLSARALRSNASRLIGMVASDLLLPLQVELVMGARARAAELDHEILIQRDGGRDAGPYAHNCDGNLVIGVLPETHQYDPMRTVNLMGGPRSSTLDVCRSDSVLAVYEGFRHLLERGYRRIGLILLSHSADNAGRDRALAESGLAVDDRLTCFFDSSNQGLDEAVRAMLDLPDPPDALVVYNVSGTPIVLRTLKQRGLTIGHDIGFIGTEAGRTDWGDLLTPTMTSMRIPAYRIGAVGAERLIARLRGDDSPPQTIEFPARLVVRESTPPRS